MTSVGTAFLIRRNYETLLLVELELPAPVPGGSPDNTFILEMDGEPMANLLNELRPIWIPVGKLSEMAYLRHFPSGPPIEEL